MCPACTASAVVVLGGVVSTGGFTALAAKLFGSDGEAKGIRNQQLKTKEKQSWQRLQTSWKVTKWSRQPNG